MPRKKKPARRNYAKLRRDAAKKAEKEAMQRLKKGTLVKMTKSNGTVAHYKVVAGKKRGTTKMKPIMNTTAERLKKKGAKVKKVNKRKRR